MSAFLPILSLCVSLSANAEAVDVSVKSQKLRFVVSNPESGVLSTNAGRALVHYKRGVAFYSEGNAEKAIESFTAAIALRPDFAEAYANRGENFQNLKQYEKAIADYDAAIRIRPDYVMAYNDRGSAEDALKRYDAALADLNKAIELDPSEPFAYDNRGWVFLDLNDPGRAIVDFEKGLSLAKDPSLVSELKEGLDKAKSRLRPVRK